MCGDETTRDSPSSAHGRTYCNKTISLDEVLVSGALQINVPDTVANLVVGL